MRFSKLYTYITLFIFCAFSLISIGDSAFIFVNDAKEENIPINDAGGAVCYTLSDNVKYTNIEKAVSIANSRATETVVVNLGVTTSIKSTINIENGTTLLIPHNEELEPYTFDGKSPVSKAQRISLVNLEGGADINVNQGGKLILGGTFGTQGINGAYSQIALGKDSSITINSTAQLYGYITEVKPIIGNSNASNIIYNNSSDPNRFIKITSTGDVESIFCAHDMGSGSTITNRVNNNICPTYKFDFRNLQTYLRVEKGGSIKTMAYVNIGSNSANALCGLAGPSGSKTDYLFYIESGYIGFEYCNAGRTLVYINGSTIIGSLFIDVGLAQIDSKKFVLPISSIFDIYINGKFDTNSKSIKFLPGSSLTIGEGSTLNIHGTGNGDEQKSKIFIYEANTLLGLGISDFGTEDCNFINNGTIHVNEFGAIAGYIQTQNTKGTSNVDLTLVSDPTNLALTTKEGNKAEFDTPLLEFKGPFYDESNVETQTSNSLFAPGNNYSSHSGAACYDGQISKLQTININVTKTNYRHNSYEYSLYLNDQPSDTGATLKYDSINNIISNTIEVNDASYIKLVDSKCENIKINGESYEIGTWYQVTTTLTIDIMPKEAFVIKCRHENGTSGSGNIARSITYGPDQSSMTFVESSSEGGSIQATMPKGWVFQVKDNSNVKADGTSKVTKTTYDENGKAINEIIGEATGKIAWDQNTIYTADADYEFYSQNVNCIAEGTDILMFDNSVKKVEELKVGDLVKVFNHETGKIDVSPIIFITHKDEESINVNTIELIFDKDVSLKIINDHALFDRTTNRYEIINKDNYKEFINHEFAIIEDNKIEFTKFIGANIKEEKLRVYCPVTAIHLNLFTNKLLTMPTFPNDIHGLYNIFDLDKNMKYDSKRKEIDIDTYGLFTYEEFIKIIYISKDAFDVSPAPYLKVSIGKGLITEEEIVLGIKYLLNEELI